MNWIVVIKIQHSMCIEWLSEIGTRFWTENSRLLVQCVTILSIQNCPLATPRFELGTPVRNVRREHGRFARWRKWSSAHSPSFPSLHLRHSSFSNPSVASPTSQLILQPFRCFTYVTAHFPTLPSLLLRHSLFTYVTWRAAHGLGKALNDVALRCFLMQRESRTFSLK